MFSKCGICEIGAAPVPEMPQQVIVSERNQLEEKRRQPREAGSKKTSGKGATGKVGMERPGRERCGVA